MKIKTTKLIPCLVETRCDCGGDLELLYSSGWCGKHDPNDDIWHYRCVECGEEFDAHFPPSDLKILRFKDEKGDTVIEIPFDDIQKVEDALWSY